MPSDNLFAALIFMLCGGLQVFIALAIMTRPTKYGWAIDSILSFVIGVSGMLYLLAATLLTR